MGPSGLKVVFPWAAECFEHKDCKEDIKVETIIIDKRNIKDFLEGVRRVRPLKVCYQSCLRDLDSLPGKDVLCKIDCVTHREASISSSF